MKQGEVYLVWLEPAEGPVVIVSATAFNQASRLPVVCPITNGGELARRIGFAVEIVGNHGSGPLRSAASA